MTQTAFDFMSKWRYCNVCDYGYFSNLVNYNRCGNCEENIRRERFTRYVIAFGK